jgi:hypothetical protein
LEFYKGISYLLTLMTGERTFKYALFLGWRRKLESEVLLKKILWRIK